MALHMNHSLKKYLSQVNFNLKSLLLWVMLLIIASCYFPIIVVDSTVEKRLTLD